MKIFDKSRKKSALAILIPFGLLFVIFVAPMTGAIVNAGNIAAAVFCVLAAFAWAFFPAIKRNKKLFTAFAVLLLTAGVGFAYAAFLSVNMILSACEKAEILPEAERSVIVLGCFVKGDVPSDMLARRLTAARDYLMEDKKAVCVVTGGQGPNETHTEASVMKEWLIQRGVGEERIFTEEKSSTTAENLKFAHDIIDDNDLPLDVVIISDGFHLWRAKTLAAKYFNEVHSVAAKTDLLHIPTYWVREWFALTKDFMSG